MINVALPKGRLGESAYERMAAAGYDCPSILEKNRKLTFENPEKGVRYFWVKPSDVSIYVERPRCVRTAGLEDGQVPHVRGRARGLL